MRPEPSVKRRNEIVPVNCRCGAEPSPEFSYAIARTHPALNSASLAVRLLLGTGARQLNELEYSIIDAWCHRQPQRPDPRCRRARDHPEGRIKKIIIFNDRATLRSETTGFSTKPVSPRRSDFTHQIETDNTINSKKDLEKDDVQADTIVESGKADTAG